MKKTFLLIQFAAFAFMGICSQASVCNAAMSLPDFDENEVKVITSRPEGEAKYYDCTGFEVAMSNEGPGITNQSSLTCIVFGEDGDVWIKDPISNDQRDSWVKGRMDSDDRTIHVATGQFTDYMPSMTFGRQLWVLDFNEATGMYSVNPSINEITYTLSDGRISLEDTSRERIIGSIFRAKGEIEEEYHYEGTWTGYGDYETVYIPYSAQPCNIPADATCEPITFRAPVYYGGQWTMKVLEAKLYRTENKDVYLSGFSSSGMYFTEPLWTVKGSEEGNKIAFPSGQFLGAYYGNPYYFTGSDILDSDERCDVMFILNGDGVYESNNIISFSMDEKGEYPYFYYDGATLTNNPLPELVTPPASARQHLFKMNYKGYIQSIDFYYDSSANVTIASTDKNVYIKGIYFGVPDSWVVGDIIDGKVVFYSTQYLGFMSEICPEMWFMAFGDEFDKPIDRIEFDYDPATGAMTNASANISVSICERRNLGMQWFFKPSFEVIDENPAKPANPDDLEWITYDWDSNAIFVFEIPMKDTEGEDLVENWLSYRIYTDTESEGVEVYSLTPEKNPDMNLSAPIDLFPYNYFDSDISYSYGRHYVTIRDDWSKFKRIGVQSVYDAGGEENCSEIVWLELTQLSVDEIVANPEDGVTYNLQGIIVKGDLTPGIYIRNGKKFIVK